MISEEDFKDAMRVCQYGLDCYADQEIYEWNSDQAIDYKNACRIVRVIKAMSGNCFFRWSIELAVGKLEKGGSQ